MFSTVCFFVSSRMYTVHYFIVKLEYKFTVCTRRMHSRDNVSQSRDSHCHISRGLTPLCGCECEAVGICMHSNVRVLRQSPSTVFFLSGGNVLLIYSTVLYANRGCASTLNILIEIHRKPELSFRQTHCHLFRIFSSLRLCVPLEKVLLPRE